MVANPSIPVNPRDASGTEPGAERKLPGPLPKMPKILETIDLFCLCPIMFMFLSGGDSRIATRGKRFPPVGANEADS